MKEQKISLVAFLILILVLITAVAFFLLRKQTLISPLPESSSLKVIFTSPPPTNTPWPTEAVSTTSSEKPTSAKTEATKTPTSPPKPTVNLTLTVTATPTAKLTP